MIWPEPSGSGLFMFWGMIPFMVESRQRIVEGPHSSPIWTEPYQPGRRLDVCRGFRRWRSCQSLTLLKGFNYSTAVKQNPDLLHDDGVGYSDRATGIMMTRDQYRLV
jgi:hypothetical protein